MPVASLKFHDDLRRWIIWSVTHHHVILPWYYAKYDHGTILHSLCCGTRFDYLSMWSNYYALRLLPTISLRSEVGCYVLPLSLTSTATLYDYIWRKCYPKASTTYSDVDYKKCIIGNLVCFTCFHFTIDNLNICIWSWKQYQYLHSRQSVFPTFIGTILCILDG